MEDDGGREVVRMDKEVKPRGQVLDNGPASTIQSNLTFQLKTKRRHILKSKLGTLRSRKRKGREKKGKEDNQMLFPSSHLHFVFTYEI